MQNADTFLLNQSERNWSSALNTKKKPWVLYFDTITHQIGGPVSFFKVLIYQDFSYAF